MLGAKWTFDNPVIAKELRGRMRGPRAYWMLLGYLLLLSVAMLLSYFAWWRGHASDLQNGSVAGSFTAGREFYMILFGVQACLVALIAPALTSGAISIEREQRTLEMLQCTTLKPRSLVAGKLVASLSYVVLLLTSSIPLISLCFLLGGVSPQEVGGAYLMLVCDAFLFGAVALCWSVYAVNTVTSVILSYLTLIVYFCVTVPFAASGFGPIMGRQSLTALNPIGAMFAAGGETWYAWHAPAWVLAAAINGGLAILACWLGVHRLEEEATRRTLGLRGYLLGFMTFLIVVIDGSNVTGGVGVSRIAPAAIVGLASLLLFLPPLVTGDYRDLDQQPETRPRRWLTFDARDAFRTASLRAVYPTAGVVAVLTSAATLAACEIWRAWGTGGPNVVSVWEVAAPAIILTFSSCVFVAGMGLFLSVLLRNRWGALCLVYVAIFLAMVTPALVYLNVDMEDVAKVARDPGIYLLYLTPVTAVSEAVQMFFPASGGSMTLGPYLPGYGSGLIWAVTSVVYLLLAAALTAIAGRIHARRYTAERALAAKHDKAIAAA